MAGNLVEVELEDGSSVSGTGNHPVWSETRQGWIALEELRPGELLAGRGGPVAIAQVKLTYPHFFLPGAQNWR